MSQEHAITEYWSHYAIESGHISLGPHGTLEVLPGPIESSSFVAIFLEDQYAKYDK